MLKAFASSCSEILIAAKGVGERADGEFWRGKCLSRSQEMYAKGACGYVFLRRSSSSRASLSTGLKQAEPKVFRWLLVLFLFSSSYYALKGSTACESFLFFPCMGGWRIRISFFFFFFLPGMQALIIFACIRLSSRMGMKFEDKFIDGWYVSCTSLWGGQFRCKRATL